MYADGTLNIGFCSSSDLTPDRIGGQDSKPAYCSTRSSCVWNSDNRVVGCCATGGSACKFYTSCVDLNSPNQTGDKDDVYTW